jgi:hypothetical protein
MVHLQSFNEKLRGMLPIKQAEKEYYKQFSVFLSRYEETKNKKTGKIGELAHISLISGEGQDNLKAKLEAINTQFRNPFIYISNWIKQEQYTLEALMSCIAYMQSLESRKAKTIRDIKEIEDDI